MCPPLTHASQYVILCMYTARSWLARYADCCTSLFGWLTSPITKFSRMLAKHIKTTLYFHFIVPFSVCLLSIQLGVVNQSCHMMTLKLS